MIKDILRLKYSASLSHEAIARSLDISKGVVAMYLGQAGAAGLAWLYHAFDFANFGCRHLSEAQYRFNRRFDLSAILVRLLRAALLTPSRPARLIRVAGVYH